MGIFNSKTPLKMWVLGWNFAYSYPWHLGTCMQNLGLIVKGVWPKHSLIPPDVQKRNILGHFFWTLNHFFGSSSFCTITKLCSQVNIPMEKWFLNPASTDRLFSWNLPFLKIRTIFWNPIFPIFGHNWSKNEDFFNLFFSSRRQWSN